MNFNPDKPIDNNLENYKISFHKKEGTIGLYIIDINGTQAGTFTILDPVSLGRLSEKKVKQIGYVNLSDEFRGKGLGKEFYIKLNDYMGEIDGSILQSGDDTTESADRVWKSLLSDGLVEKVGLTPASKDRYQFVGKDKQ